MAPGCGCGTPATPGCWCCVRSGTCGGAWALMVGTCDCCHHCDDELLWNGRCGGGGASAAAWYGARPRACNIWAKGPAGAFDVGRGAGVKPSATARLSSSVPHKRTEQHTQHARHSTEYEQGASQLTQSRHVLRTAAASRWGRMASMGAVGIVSVPSCGAVSTGSVSEASIFLTASCASCCWVSAATSSNNFSVHPVPNST